MADKIIKAWRGDTGRWWYRFEGEHKNRQMAEAIRSPNDVRRHLTEWYPIYAVVILAEAE